MFKNKNVFFTFILLSIVIFLLTFFSGVVNDYGLYLKNWNISNVGANPWVTEFNGISVRSSSYGPLHTLIGYLALINPLMPKILFGGTSLIVFLLLVSAKNSVIKNFKKNDLFIILLLYPLFPLTIITAYIYGINDSIIALLVIIACKTRQQKKMLITGAVLGLGALLKFYPLLFLTFFSLSSKKGISLKCLLSGITVFCLGMSFSYFIWGIEILNPLMFGADRTPKLLSILKFFNYINDYYSFYIFDYLINFLIDKNSVLILVVVIAIFIHGYMAEIEWEYISIIGTLLIFATYKVGHPQFYVSWTVLLAWLITSSVPGSEKNLFAWRLLPIAIYLGIFQSVYFLSGLIDNGHLRNNWQIIRDLGSVPFLFIILLCLYKNKFFFIKPWKKKEINFW
tara:strand:- start:2267 stop:3457 length:1191 start_codon:yes stop_codon:yes gene_type:complete